MLYHPEIDPVLLTITDFLQIRWYGVMYVIGIFLAWAGLSYKYHSDSFWDQARINDLFLYSAWGVLLGGRLGYMLFYDLENWMASPLRLFAIQGGGMSFHGGFLGVVIANAYFAYQHGIKLLTVTDYIAPVVPIGLAAGRLGNFINGELWGRIAPADLPWAMVFAQVDGYPRHPSPLYAIFLEGLVLFIIIRWYAAKQRVIGQISSVFLIGYGSIRIFEEYFRVPDPQYGYLAFGWLTMGQVLCVPMVLVGGYLLFTNYFTNHKICKPI